MASTTLTEEKVMKYQDEIDLWQQRHTVRTQVHPVLGSFLNYFPRAGPLRSSGATRVTTKGSAPIRGLLSQFGQESDEGAADCYETGAD